MQRHTFVNLAAGATMAAVLKPVAFAGAQEPKRPTPYPGVMTAGATAIEGFINQSGMVSLQTDFGMSPDITSEVKVLSANYDAQYGDSTSGQQERNSLNKTKKRTGWNLQLDNSSFEGNRRGVGPVAGVQFGQNVLDSAFD